MEGSLTNYIDAERLREKITDRLDLFRELSSDTISPIRIDECKQIIDIIDSLQQDETQVDKMLCSQVWWEEQGWIMISPDATVEGIDSLLKQVRKKLQQEQPSLPSGLDEAAEEYVKDYGYTEDDYKRERIIAEEHFKAGAEWMAGKYEKIEGELVDWYSTSDGKDYCCGVKTIDSFEAPEGFYIRKK